jgi:glycosyltransferase involved in cell wall biosynthesis
MPVYNEEACIASVVTAWLEVLRGTGASFRLLAINDGSRDATIERLGSVTDTELDVADKQNEGHGPTILRGYSIAVEQSDWVFQVDSDDELPAGSFPMFWERREHFDILLGIRRDRVQTAARAAISAVSRMSVRVLCGKGAADVNVPYRLMRSECLKSMLSAIPPDTFAPNVAIAGLAISRGLRIANIPVPSTPRRTGTPSLVKWGLVKSAARSLAQTVSILS